jgi:hypothetical protein
MVLQDARLDEEGVVANIIIADHVTAALNAVTNTVFPHRRALETQKLWMTQEMFKQAPKMTTGQTAAAINQLNYALPLFPNGTEGSKLTPQELIGLLEWLLPPAWRTKFNFDGYVPSLHPKTKLLEACKAIERNKVTIDNRQKCQTSLLLSCPHGVYSCSLLSLCSKAKQTINEQSHPLFLPAPPANRF